MPRWVLGLLVLVVAVACRSSNKPATRASGLARPPAVTLLAQNLALYPGDTRATRLGFETLSDSTDFIINYRPDTAHLRICPLQSINAELPARASCKDGVASGVRDTISSPGLRAVAIVVEGERLVQADARLEYDEGGRHISVVIPVLRQPQSEAACKDNRCNPFFELRPLHSGRFSASARWNGPSATLVLLQGSVLGRSFTATGIPYREGARADGPSPLEVSTRLAAPGEYALAITQRAGPQAGDLSDVVVTASWP